MVDMVCTDRAAARTIAMVTGTQQAALLAALLAALQQVLVASTRRTHISSTDVWLKTLVVKMAKTKVNLAVTARAS